MKKILLVAFSLLFASFSYAQQGVSINISGNPADPSAMLDVSSASKGLLIPRVALISINDITTIANPSISLLVFNTNAAMIGGAVGFWYFNGTIWVQALGPQGVQGPVGPTGPQGLQGVQGTTGPQGIQGAVGATGPQGLQGVQGATGPQGIQGAVGATGLQGLQGVQGATGPQGIQGAVGATGPQGLQGVQGATGPQGIQGAVGATGPQGLQGVQGATGPQGIQGAVGATGPQGLQGVQGATGPQGIQGAVGATGATGTAGTNGTNGAIGATGVTGATGPVGCATANTVLKSNGTAATCSQIFDNGVSVGINTNTPNASAKLHIYQPGAQADLRLMSDQQDNANAGGRVSFWAAGIGGYEAGSYSCINTGYGEFGTNIRQNYFGNALSIYSLGPYANRYSNLAVGTTLYVSDVENGTVVNKVGIGIANPAHKLQIYYPSGISDVKIGQNVWNTGYDNVLYFGDGGFAYIGETYADDVLTLYGAQGIRIGPYGNYGTAGQVLTSDGTLAYWANPPAAGITGTCASGTNYVPKMSSATAITCSQIFDDGTTVGLGINTSLNPTSKLHIYNTGALAELTLQSNGHDGPTAGGRIIFNNDVLGNAQGNITFVNDGYGSSYMGMGITYFSNAITINGDGPFASRNSNLAVGTTLFVSDVESGSVVNKVGIGTTAPAQKLDVYSSNTSFAVNGYATTASYGSGGNFTGYYSGTSNPSYSYGVMAYGNGNGYQDSYGVYGYANGTTYVNRGGYFANSMGGYAYVGAYNGAAQKILGNGAVSEIVPTENHGRVTLTCPESPEYWYQDYGTVNLVNGKAHVDLDPILADIIVVNEENPLKVFCQINIVEANDVAVVNKTASGFDIIEKNGGTHSGEIDYQIIAKPKTNYGQGRFVQAPGPGFLKAENDPQKAKAANTGTQKIWTWPADWDVYNYNPADYCQPGKFVEGGKYNGYYKNADGKLISPEEYSKMNNSK